MRGESEREASPRRRRARDRVRHAQEADRVRDVVHAENRGSARRGGAERRERARQPLGGGRVFRDAREAPDEALAGRARGDRKAERAECREVAEQDEVVLGRLAEPEARVERERVRGDAGRLGPRGPRRPETRRSRRRGGRTGGRPASFSGRCPFMCIRIAPARLPAIVSNISASKRPADTSLTRSAPASSAARATAALRVSIDNGASVFARISAMTGTTRAISSSGGSGRASP